MSLRQIYDQFVVVNRVTPAIQCSIVNQEQLLIHDDLVNQPSLDNQATRVNQDRVAFDNPERRYMLIKDTRTFDSFMNAIALHLSSGDWDAEVEGDGDISFGPEWQGRTAQKNDLVVGIELYHPTYSDTELIVVEKAIGLMEGLDWSKETIESMEKPRRRRAGAEVEE